MLTNDFPKLGGILVGSVIGVWAVTYGASEIVRFCLQAVF